MENLDLDVDFFFLLQIYLKKKQIQINNRFNT